MIRIDPDVTLALIAIAFLVVVVAIRSIVMMVGRRREAARGADNPPQTASVDSRSDIPKESTANGGTDRE